MSARRSRTLVLWDVDLTLVDLRGVGGTWYREALSTVTGVDLVHTPSFAGRTERAITTDLLTTHGVAVTDETITAMHEALAEVALREHGGLAEHGRALPGSAEVLAALAAQDGVVQSVVTGNLVEIARYKLAAFGLDRHVDLTIGGYGVLSEHRPDLVTEAVRLAAAKHGERFPPDSVVVVGDTPHDVAAALHHGAVAVGVATGRSSTGELREAGAHVVLEDLSDTAAVVDALLAAR
ncbi:HAD family hydrolase [Umezawaea beigongshangensis]|uniref:HAD family hydrolase n=1 Tax=Umezawaea beigongshangensis TaxID=2780383 RepID=UPI0018F18C3D|nr:haloacid dehalogenase-like hydrolase [Umezawaea beigongshangensis]